MRQLFALAALSAVSNALWVNTADNAKRAAQEKAKYADYMAQFNKTYGTISEMRTRQAQFRQADIIIDNINRDVDITGKGAKAAHNFTSDMTNQEFAALTTGRVYAYG